MSKTARPSWVSPLLSCVTLLLFCAAFVRVELKMKQQDARLDALEKQGAHLHSVLFGECPRTRFRFSCTDGNQIENGAAYFSPGNQALVGLISSA